MELERLICVSVLPEELAERIDSLRLRLSAVGGAREALAYPVHLTLRTGFLAPGSEITGLLDEFGESLGSFPPPRLRSRGLWRTSYEAGGELRFLIAFEVEASPELLSLHKRLLGYRRYMKGEQYEYRPHVTLAFHDLGVEGFAACCRWLNEGPPGLDAGFEWKCDNVCLCSKHGERWEELRRYSLES